MTAMDVFISYAKHGEWIEELEEKIRRREAMATGSGSRPSDTEGRSSGDASVRLLDYVGNVEELREKLKAAQAAREEDRGCAIYISEMLPGPMGGVMVRMCLEGKSAREAAEEMGYSVSHVKRLRREAEKLCGNIRIISWDRRHVPVLAVPENAGG